MKWELFRVLNLRLLIAILCIFPIFTILSCEKPAPTDQDWSLAMSALVEDVENGVFNNFGVKYDTTRIDYFVTNKKWFVALVASFGDSVAAYQPYIGRLHENSMILQFLSPIKKLDHNGLENYLILVETGRLHTLIGEKGFWQKEDNLQTMWKCAIHHNINGAFTETGAGFKMIKVNSSSRD